MFSLDDPMDNQNLWNCGSISPKTILIFSKNSLNFWSDTIEKQRIIKLSSYNSSMFLSDFEVTFLDEGNDVAFRPFLYCVLFIYSVT